MRAHQINPKNGRPYNQLALLAMYTVSDAKLIIRHLFLFCLKLSAHNGSLSEKETGRCVLLHAVSYVFQPDA